MSKRSVFPRWDEQRTDVQWADQHPALYAFLVALGSAVAVAVAYALLASLILSRPWFSWALIVGGGVGISTFFSWRRAMRLRAKR